MSDIKGEFDLIVIGAGPGGYVAAIRAAQLGLKTACVESRSSLGGTCLNVGCIPSKAMLQSSEHYSHAKHGLENHGVVVKGVSLDLDKMLARKDDVVKSLTKGVEGLFKKNKITWLKGRGSFLGPNTISVKDGDKAETYKAKHFIIATGSEPIELKSIAPFDGESIVHSTHALSFNKVPDHLVVIGAGVIGLELGSVWLRLGSKVTVIEAADRVLAVMDDSVSKGMHKILSKQGMEFVLGAKVKQATKSGKGVKVVYEKDGKDEEIKGDKCLVAVGRRPNTDGLDLAKAGLETMKNGRIAVDHHYRTSVPHILAIGDVIEGVMLAHKAEDEGIAAAEIIAGKPGHVNYEAIPNVVYTWPEVASVGMTEEQCKAKGIEVRTGQFPFMANGRARSLGETDGFVKIIADARTDRLLGFHIVGPSASEMIAEAAIAFEFGASAEDIARSSHAHPTLAEIMKEAALAVDKRTIHI
jgi:dihydrolipoamide dehydrogenase